MALAKLKTWWNGVGMTTAIIACGKRRGGANVGRRVCCTDHQSFMYCCAAGTCDRQSLVKVALFLMRQS